MRCDARSCTASKGSVDAQPTTASVPSGVGTVEKNGPGASKFKVGQRVVGVPLPGVAEGNGTWQQYHLAPEDGLVCWHPPGLRHWRLVMSCMVP